MRRFLILSIFVVGLLASCPNDCSGHGVCQSTTCKCQTNYAGSDCSIYDELLKNGQVSHGVVNTREWRYYHIQAKSDHSNLVIMVNQTTPTGDCDTYVRLGDYPTKRVYDFRDISTNKEIKIEVPHPDGTYYIGIFGFLGTSFDIVASISSQCENDCSHHGSCVGENECSCYVGWTGDNCGTPIKTMTNSTVYPGSVGLRLWNYYSFENTQNTLVVNLSQTGGGDEDCDLYIRFGESLPSLVSYDYRDTTVNSEHSMKIGEAETGQYMIGVYGFKECSYNIVAETFNECPNQCSGAEHGTCLSGDVSCQCMSSFEGDGCETMIPPLSYDSPVTGFVEKEFWNYYHFSPSSSSNALVTVMQDDPDMDCDMYIRRGELPDRTHYDYRNISLMVQNFTIVIENPSFEVHNIGVYGYKTCSYSIFTHLSGECPNSCTDSNHGTCDDGHCICKDGWTGDDCSRQMNNIDLDTTIESSVVADHWKYYSFDAKMGYEVVIFMRELNSTGFLWLYESRNSFPSTAEYDNADTETNSEVHNIVFTPDSDMVVYVGVFGSPLSIELQLYGFKLVAWQASNLGASAPLRLRSHN